MMFALLDGAFGGWLVVAGLEMYDVRLCWCDSWSGKVGYTSEVLGVLLSGEWGSVVQLVGFLSL